MFQNGGQKRLRENSEDADDVFTVRFKNGDMYKVKVSEMIPTKKIIWEVIDSYQGWHNDHTEWVGTKIIWEVLPKTESIEVKMTHEGLVPNLSVLINVVWDGIIL